MFPLGITSWGSIKISGSQLVAECLEKGSNTGGEIFVRDSTHTFPPSSHIEVHRVSDSDMSNDRYGQRPCAGDLDVGQWREFRSEIEPVRERSNIFSAAVNLSDWDHWSQWDDWIFREHRNCTKCRD